MNILVACEAGTNLDLHLPGASIGHVLIRELLRLWPPSGGIFIRLRPFEHPNPHSSITESAL